MRPAQLLQTRQTVFNASFRLGLFGLNYALLRPCSRLRQFDEEVQGFENEQDERDGSGKGEYVPGCCVGQGQRARGKVCTYRWADWLAMTFRVLLPSNSPNRRCRRSRRALHLGLDGLELR